MIASRFERHPEGFAYFPHLWSRGYVVSVEERRSIERDAIAHALKFAVPAAAVLLAISVALWLAARIFLAPMGADLVLDIGLGVSAIVALIWGVTRPSNIVRDRQPSLPRRSIAANDRAEGENVSGWVLAAMWLCVPVWTLFYIGFAYAYPWIGVPLGLLALWGVVRLIRWTVFKFRSPSAQ